MLQSASASNDEDDLRQLPTIVGENVPDAHRFELCERTRFRDFLLTNVVILGAVRMCTETVAIARNKGMLALSETDGHRVSS